MVNLLFKSIHIIICTFVHMLYLLIYFVKIFFIKFYFYLYFYLNSFLNTKRGYLPIISYWKCPLFNWLFLFLKINLFVYSAFDLVYFNCFATSSAKFSSFFSIPSPFSNLTNLLIFAFLEATKSLTFWLGSFTNSWSSKQISP